MSAEAVVGGDEDAVAWRVVVPEGWVLAEVARERLEEAAADAPDDVVALGAPAERPGPGVSGQVHAERRSLATSRRGALATPPSGGASAPTTVGGAYRGAVAVRSTVAAEATASGVVLADGVAVAPAPGAATHDPWAPAAAPADAVPEGRPPFPLRPVVLFLGLEDDLDHADAARGLVNGLLRRGVEGRLAVPAVPEGLLLAVPAAPTRATVEALRPEVVVVLDAEAAEAADRWTAGMRGTVVVELTRDIALGVELVSWRIGVAQGRLRARIGPRTGPRQLAELVNRLVAGPQPEPPDDREPAPGGAPVALAPRRSRARRPRRRAVVVHPVEGPTRRSSGLAAHLGANGWQVDAGPPAAVVAGAARADLVVGDAVSLPVLLTRLGRSRPGRVVTDLSAADLHGGTDAPVPGEANAPDVPSLGAAALGAVGLTDAALAPSAVLVDAARRTGARALWVPDLYPADVLERYATARRHADRTGDPVIGWVVGGHQPSPAVVDALARAVIGLLAQQVRVDLFVTGSASRPDEGPLGEQFAALAAHPAVRVRPGRPDPDTLASWWGQLWAPGPTVVARTGDTSVLVEAAAAGVPSVAPATSVGPARGLLDVSALVDEPTRAGAWHAAVRPLLAASTRDGRRSQAHDRVVALHGRVAGASVVRRLTGWLDQAAVRS